MAEFLGAYNMVFGEILPSLTPGEDKATVFKEVSEFKMT